ncbi:MAG: M20/M25/M40 family metallo-hydrolase [Gemmatimonadota bacterium]
MKRNHLVWRVVVLAVTTGLSAGCGELEPAPEEVAAPVLAEEYREEVERLAADERIRAAFRIVEELEPRTMDDLIALTEISAPPFMEDERAEEFVRLLEEAGAREVHRDGEGNVIAVRPGVEGDRVVVVSAHLDTVFPEGTDVTVQFRGDTLFAPGVGDDARGLAVLLALLRALEEAALETRADLWFVGTVGEEGLGDLRGVKHLFREGGPPIDAFISIDGDGDETVIHQALGSRRYRATVVGPGGHSWSDFGVANPAHALALALSRFDQEAAAFVADGPRTSYNVGRVGGGTSVNSVPFETWAEVDMRSVDPERLSAIDELFVEVLEAALSEYNARGLDESVSLKLDRVGDRPSGEVDLSVPLVQRSMAVVQHFGGEPELRRSSTDANVPIARGIPAVTLARGGSGGGAHSLDEWWVNEDGHLGIQQVLLVVLAESGLAD